MEVSYNKLPIRYDGTKSDAHHWTHQWRNEHGRNNVTSCNKNAINYNLRCIITAWKEWRENVEKNKEGLKSRRWKKG